MSHQPPVRRSAPRDTSCGVVVTDGDRILLGHATRSPRWDIPKGLAEPGESFAEAAARELDEETGLTVAAGALVDLGIYTYLPRKNLALFAWLPPRLPDLATLVCRSTFTITGRVLPEFDRFGLFDWDEALQRVGRNLARILPEVRMKLPPHLSFG